MDLPNLNQFFAYQTRFRFAHLQFQFLALHLRQLLYDIFTTNCSHIVNARNLFMFRFKGLYISNVSHFWSTIFISFRLIDQLVIVRNQYIHQFYRNRRSSDKPINNLNMTEQVKSKQQFRAKVAYWAPDRAWDGRSTNTVNSMFLSNLYFDVHTQSGDRPTSGVVHRYFIKCK